jgi:uncharacterized low-complexity protein
MGGRREPVPRRHCPHCDLPASTGAFPPDLAGKSCTATFGVDGPSCSRKAETVDRHGRPICNAPVWTNVTAHEIGAHREIAETAANAYALSRLAPVAQEPEQSEDAASPSGAVTLADVREAVRDELDSFATEVLKIPATMGQKQAALHPVGLCGDGRCGPCKSQRSSEHSQARKILAGEIESAIEHRGRETVAEMVRADGADAIGDVLDEWWEAGRPQGERKAEQIGVVRHE